MKKRIVAASANVPGRLPLLVLLAWWAPATALAQAQAAAPAAVREAALNPSIVQHAQGKTLYSFRAEDLDLKAALAVFARANGLNIVPDQDVTGTITLDVRGLPLDEIMQALLEANDYSWEEKRGLIRVRSVKTQTFTVDYLRLSRQARSQSSAMLNSATAGGSGASGGGGSSGGSSGGGSSAGGGAGDGSSVSLTQENTVDFWKELKEEIGKLLTVKGKETMAVNMTGGVLQITDRPAALKRVEDYLRSLDNTLGRQVEIEARIYDVSLNNQFQFGIDWVHVAEAYGGSMGFGGATLPAAIGSSTLGQSALNGLGPAQNMSTLVFNNFNSSAAVQALQTQGKVEVISKPRIRTLNNQTALIKVGSELPFFSQTVIQFQSQSGPSTISGDLVTTVTIGTILSITPQISEDGWITMDISPVLTSLDGILNSPSGTATAPQLNTKQASTIVRVRDGSTIMLGGLIRTEEAKNERKVPLLGDIPLLGKLFTGTFKARLKTELVIFVTPTLVH
jgi:MSHA type pilus biogenesis protein MshL